MTEPRLPMIAVALAVVAVVLVPVSLVVRSRKRYHAVPAAPLPADAAVIERDEQPPPPPRADPTPPAIDASVCVPCGKCSAAQCKCHDGTEVNAIHCINGCCLSPDQTCIKSCEPNGGWP